VIGLNAVLEQKADPVAEYAGFAAAGASFDEDSGGIDWQFDDCALST
jgi:hypothetical protein